MKVNIKHGKNVYTNVELDMTSDVASFKALVYSLTSVPADRQKLMTKGGWSAMCKGVLKDDTPLDALTITEGAAVNLMGTAEVIKAPTEAVVFIEDMTEVEKATKGATIPAGLNNLGNTCYMNSTLQCLRAMPELRADLATIPSSEAANFRLAPMAGTLRDTFTLMDRSTTALQPVQFLAMLHRNFANFAERSPRGGLMQHDAEEFFNSITQSLSDGLAAANKSLTDHMTIQMEETLTCKETDSEPVKRSTDMSNKLTCNMQKSTKHLKEGVMLGLEGEVELHSDVLGRNAIWTRKQRIAQLPRYICVHFMRFFWKETPESRDHTGVKCKVVKELTFNDTFDIFDMCSEKLQKQMAANRLELDRQLDVEMEKKRAKLGGADSASVAANAESEGVKSSGSEPAPASAMEVEGAGAGVGNNDDDDDDEATALREALAMSLGTSGEAADSTAGNAPVFGSGIPDSFTGDYELMGVVTHKGRDADSGHYIGWVRQSPGSDYWWKYDDDKVTEVGTAEIIALKGGGDWHTAYLNFYRFKA